MIRGLVALVLQLSRFQIQTNQSLNSALTPIAMSRLLFALLALASPLAFEALPANYPTVAMHGVHGDVPMPLVGLGTWQYNSSVTEVAVHDAFKLGFRHVDTAYMYQNQDGVGRGLKKAGLKREEYFVTTKIPGGLNASET